MRLTVATLWLLVAGALSAGVYWLFLNTPESTVWMLIASTLLAAVFVAGVGVTVSGAVAIWSSDRARAAVAPALRSIPAIVPALLVVAIIWWAASRVDTWLALRNGQISAWFIARFGWADVSWLFASIRYAGLWLRWIVAALLAASLIGSWQASGARAMAQLAWVRRALRPRALLLATVWFLVLIALPWLYLVPWRPASLPPTSVELVFIGAKLSLSAVLAAVGVALIIREVVIPNAPRTPEEAAQAA